MTLRILHQSSWQAIKWASQARGTVARPWVCPGVRHDPHLDGGR